MIKIAVMGYGTIGSGVVKVIETNGDSIAKKIGDSIEVKYVLDLREFEGDPIQSKVVHDYKTIAEDPEVSIVVETMGGVEPAYTFVKEMLLAGKSVTTSNKALVAAHGADLLAAAREKNVNFMFEASVGGGIPIIRAINTCLSADVVEEISGIINGTTNYILSKMSDEGCAFEDVLKDAQEKGYAEKDPTADVEGHDAGRKIAILTSLISGRQVDFEDVYTEGITKISAEDITYAKKLGRSIKLLAMSKREGDTYSIMVAPFLLPKEHPLSMVNGVFNAVFVHGNMLGDAMFYGSGAGSLPTASAVVADVVELAKNQGRHMPVEWQETKLIPASLDERESSFFVRTGSSWEQVQKIFGAVEYVEAIEGEIGFVTPVMTEKQFAESKRRLSDCRQVIRMY